MRLWGYVNRNLISQLGTSLQTLPLYLFNVNLGNVQSCQRIC